MGRHDRVGRHETEVIIAADGSGGIVRYHNTDVVRFTNTMIELNTGGWQTATTKLRMNQAAAQFGLNYGVSQVNGQWIVRRNDHRGGCIEHAFNQGILRFPRRVHHTLEPATDSVLSVEPKTIRPTWRAG